MASKSAYYLRVKVRDLFPADDPVVPFLLRLMAAVNDLRTLQKLWLYAESRVGHTQSEKEIIKAEHIYLFRLTSGTLYETALAFQDLKKELANPQVLGIIEKLPEYGRNAFNTLDNLFPEGFVDGKHYGKILVRLRNSVFHYDQPKVFRSELQKHGELGDLIIGEIVGVSRYLLADDLQVQITTRPLGSDITAEIPALGQMVSQVTRYFGQLVDSMVGFYLWSREGAIVEKLQDSVDGERLWQIPS
ncbi:MAG: hypothetical protein ACE5I9_04820 [Candidatus Methylomirabilales bacterium]